ncbi:MAG: putative toxin-antitoxin system toxin component, PIN family [Thermoplasmatota archaeon]
MRKRIVLDTNILISAIGWNGPERRIIEKAIEGEYELLIGKELISEFIGVISREKFSKIRKEDIRRFLILIFEIFEVVKQRTTIDAVFEDPDDNKILECAVDGNADYIVTGDEHLLSIREFRGIKIIRSKNLIELEDLN